jgi:hypothetical protein
MRGLGGSITHPQEVPSNPWLNALTGWGQQVCLHSRASMHPVRTAKVRMKAFTGRPR